MSRLFDGTDDEVTWSIGGCVITGAYTFAMIMKLSAPLTWMGFLSFEASGSAELGVERTANVTPHRFSCIRDGGTTSVNWGPDITAFDGAWWFVAVSRPAGAAQQHRYTSCLIGGTPVHLDGSNTNGNHGTTADGIVFGNTGGSDPYSGRLAVCAYWNTNLSDADRASLHNTMTRANWLSKSPNFLVDELDGFGTDFAGTSTRTGLVGTSDDADDPTGWSSWTGTSSVAFPATPILDDFNRADENPAVGWGAFKVDTNQLAPTGTGNLEAWDTAMTGPDVEAYLDFPVLPPVGSLTILNARSNADGTWYALEGGNENFWLYRRNAWTQTYLGVATPALAAGDALGIRCVGSTIEAWMRKSGVWTLAGVAVDSGIDGTAPNNQLGLYHDGGGSLTARFDNFGGGTLAEKQSFYSSRRRTVSR